MSRLFKEGDLVAVSLKEGVTLQHCLGKCLGTVASELVDWGPKYVVNVFGVGLRTIDPDNPYYPVKNRADGDRMQPHTDAYINTPCRRIDAPRFEIERDPARRLFHLVIRSFAMGTCTPWIPYERLVTHTVDEFVIHATGENGILDGFVGPWTVFTTNRVACEVKEGTDPFEKH